VTEFAGDGLQTELYTLLLELILPCDLYPSRNVIHRDLNTENISLDWDRNVRIADFGHSTSPDKPEHPSATNPDALQN
jgi:serine/threonine protein kinase